MNTKKASINEKLNIVTNVLHDNTEIILQTDTQLAQLEENIADIEPLDKLHAKALSELKTKIWRKQCKTKIIIIFIVMIILLIIILAGACSKGYCK
jgi:phosphate uptake regulator